MKHISDRMLPVLAFALAIGACGQAEPPAFMEYALPDVPAGGHCVLEAINGAPADDAAAVTGSQVLFSGWVTDASKQSPPEALLVLKGSARSYSTPLRTGGDRPDVAAVLDSETARLSGYNTTAVLGIEPGEYDVLIVHLGVDLRTCPLNKRLVVNAA